MGEKACSECGIVQSLSSFSRDKHHFTGHKSACKSCAKKHFSAWRSANLDRARKTDRVSHYMRKYGLPIEKATALAESRAGICEICMTPSHLVVDHCHSTGKVRGMICGACNSALGYARESISTLRSLIRYIERHNS